MKRVLIALALVLSVVFCTALVTQTSIDDGDRPTLKRRNCTGYVVIEAGKGIDCNGDTVKLKKKHGYFELASNAPAAHRP